MKKIPLILFVITSLITACSQKDTKLNWAPEYAVPVNNFTLDLNKHIDFANFCIHYFYMIDARTQNTALFHALNNSIQDSVKRRLPEFVRNQVDTFSYRVSANLPILDYAAPILLNTLSENLLAQGSVATENLLIYNILTSFPDELLSIIKDSLQNISVNFKETLELNLEDLTENLENVLQSRVLINIAAPLSIHATISAYFLDPAGMIFETLLSDNERLMPFPDGKMNVVRTYDYDQTKQIADVHKVSVAIRSDSIGFDIEQLKDLSQRKIEMRMGIALKVNLDNTI
ncbi:MAG: hypothetical protein ACRC9X_04560 [Bacteroidales bacterium]